MIRKLRNLGITVQAIEQQADLSIPGNMAMIAIYLAFQEINNERRSIKIKGGMQAALKSGRWCTKAPRGYKNTRDENNRPVIVPTEDSVWKIRLLRASHSGLTRGVIPEMIEHYNLECKQHNTSNNRMNNSYHLGLYSLKRNRVLTDTGIST